VGRQKTWGKQLDAAAAPLRFAPEEEAAFCAQFGWRVAETRQTIEEAQRLKRAPRGLFIWKLLSLMRSKKVRERQAQGMSGVVLLEGT